MNINKRLDRVKQWAGEKVGAGSKTSVSDEFKALELEMTLRHEGMEQLHKSMTSYVKSLSKRKEAEDKEKVLPVAYLGQTMVTHGEDFEHDSEFGNCLIGLGRTNERVARIQETYLTQATNGWLESLERSLAQMKEYQAARKKLEQRRLAYDASLSKMQKAKKEDYRVEEELRSQKAKYEESSEDVLRRMEDIKEAEGESVADLGAFLDAELEYYDRCRDELLRMKKEWPAASSRGDSRRNPRSRSNTAHSYVDRYDEEPEPELPARPAIRSQARVHSTSRLPSQPEYLDAPLSPPRPHIGSRAYTFQGPTTIRSEKSPRIPIIATDPSMLQVNLRPTRINTAPSSDVFGDPSDSSTVNSASPDHYSRGRSVSPATSHGSMASRSPSYGNLRGGAVGGGKKGPPPPPPVRAKKPPPPLPMKRAEISSGPMGR